MTNEERMQAIREGLDETRRRGAALSPLPRVEAARAARIEATAILLLGGFISPEEARRRVGLPVSAVTSYGAYYQYWGRIKRPFALAAAVGLATN